jgi:hypothetical protein
MQKKLDEKRAAAATAAAQQELKHSVYQPPNAAKNEKTPRVPMAAPEAATAATQQTTDLERLKAQAASGGEKQALQQEIDNIKYQQFMDQQNYQKQQLDYLSNILRGNAAALGSTQVSYAPAPSLASQLGGLGLAGLGLYGMLNKG